MNHQKARDCLGDRTIARWSKIHPAEPFEQSEAEAVSYPNRLRLGQREESSRRTTK